MTTESERLKREVCDFIAGEPNAERFNELALELFSWHVSKLPRYRAFCERRVSDLRTIRDYRAIPPLPVEAFKHGDLSVLSEAARRSAALPGEKVSRRSIRTRSMSWTWRSRAPVRATCSPTACAAVCSCWRRPPRLRRT
jgi:hypothetical protein